MADFQLSVKKEHLSLEITLCDIKEIFSLRMLLEISVMRSSYNRISVDELADVRGYVQCIK
jgi:DNA-binding GntR family transcriptional regulator